MSPTATKKSTRAEKRRKVANRRTLARNRRVLPATPPRAASPIGRMILDGRRVDLRVGPRLLAATLERGIAQSTTITLTLMDEDRALLRSGEIGARALAHELRLELDGLAFVAAGISKTGNQLEITFEDEIVVKLKKHGRQDPLRYPRARWTRAQAVADLLRRAGAPVLVLDENARQPIAGQAQLRRQLRAQGSGRRTAAHPSQDVTSWADRLYPRHFQEQSGFTQLSSHQVHLIALQAGLPALAFEQIAKGESTYFPGVVQHDPGDGYVGWGLWQITPNSWGSGSVLHQKLDELGGQEQMLNPWKCALMARFMYDQGGLQPWNGTAFLTDAGRASKPDPRYRDPVAPSDESGGPASSSSVIVREYVFERRRGESTWAAGKRMMDEVQWRMFVREGVVILASDPALFRATPTLRVTERSPAVETLDMQWHRALRAQQLTAQVRIDRWAADPGDVVAVDDLPDTARYWLIAKEARSLQDPDQLATLDLIQPQRSLREPAPQTDQRTITAGGSGSGSTSSGSDPDPAAVVLGDGLVYPLTIHGTFGGGVAAHMARAWGNWQSDNAVDIYCPRGTPVLAVCAGTVIKLGGSWDGTGASNPNGYNVTLAGADNSWFYTHLMTRRPEIQVGSKVRAGQLLGASGAAKGVWHLHIACEHGDPERLLRV